MKRICEEVSEARQTGCGVITCVCVRARAEVCVRCCVCICSSAYVSVVHARVLCVEVGVSVCVSKIINHPQKRVIPLLCVRVDCRGSKEERKC